MIHIAVDTIFSTHSIHTSEGQVDQIVRTRCVAAVSVYLSRSSIASMELPLSADEMEVYNQLVVKIENRVRHQLRNEL